MRVLLTGGRAPFALEMARILHFAGGHHVVMAESVPLPLSFSSAAVAAHVRLPSPRASRLAYAVALADAIRTHRIDLVIPMCEDALHVAAVRAYLQPTGAAVLVEDISKMVAVHSKYEFSIAARAAACAVPETILLTRPEQLDSSVQPSSVAERSEDWVLKPVFSRFGTETLVRPSHAQLGAVQASLGSGVRWVAQRFVPGYLVCSYSVCAAGRVLAHTAYRSLAAVNGGASAAFQVVRLEAVDAWVERFVAHQQWTGQIAIDFIVQPGSAGARAWAIECNPRGTSGVHAFSIDGASPELAARFAAIVTGIKLAPSTLRAGVPTRLVWHSADGAAQVLLTGSFSGWRDHVVLTRDPSADHASGDDEPFAYSVQLRLPVGRHMYKVLENGKWAMHRHAEACFDESTGRTANVLVVLEPHGSAASPQSLDRAPLGPAAGLDGGRCLMLDTAVSLLVVPSASSLGGLAHSVLVWLRSIDVIFAAYDMRPWLTQVLSMGAMVVRGWHANLDPVRASTMDIVWDDSCTP